MEFKDVQNERIRCGLLQRRDEIVKKTFDWSLPQKDLAVRNWMRRGIEERDFELVGAVLDEVGAPVDLDLKQRLALYQLTFAGSV